MSSRAKHKLTRLVFSTSLAAALLVSAFSQGCGGGGGGGASAQKVTLILGAYTTPREAYGKAIIPAFQKYWKEKTGQEVVFQESYQGSGAQSRAIIGGFEADITALSLGGSGTVSRGRGFVED